MLNSMLKNLIPIKLCLSSAKSHFNDILLYFFHTQFGEPQQTGLNNVQTFIPKYLLFFCLSAVEVLVTMETWRFRFSSLTSTETFFVSKIASFFGVPLFAESCWCSLRCACLAWFSWRRCSAFSNRSNAFIIASILRSSRVYKKWY